MTRLCIKAIGREFEFMNIDAAIANDLLTHTSSIHLSFTHRGHVVYLCDFLSLRSKPSRYATPIEIMVVTTKKIGMIHSSLSLAITIEGVTLTAKKDRMVGLPGDKKNATLEKRRDGVNMETLRRLSCCWRMTRR